MRLLRPALLLAVLAMAVFSIDAPRRGPERDAGHDREREVEHEPSDWFFAQRAFPFDTIPQTQYVEALEQVRADRAAIESPARSGTRAQGAADAIQWEQAGPFNIGGRIAAVAALPGGSTVYIGSANGGVFKSTDAGGSWAPVFDHTGVASIGALAIDPNNSQVVYAGTGEANGAVDNYDGAGLYRTTNGGGIWASLGLASTAHIARVVVDPRNSSRLFVAAMGKQFSTGPDRGLYRSEDGGVNWTKVLFVNDSTGACDVVIDPARPETVYAATWERVRRPTYRRAGGPGCGIWRSLNHGTTWTRLAGGLPVPSDDVGRIGLTIPRSQPSTVYAQIMSGGTLGYVGLGFYRSTNSGVTWARRDPAGGTFENNFGGFGWYFGDVAVDPTNPLRLFALGVDLLRSTNGGTSWTVVTGAAHVDFHAFWFDPSNSSHDYACSDGGFFYSSDGGSTWTKGLDLPISQFYAGSVDVSDPTRLVGGTQDNGSLISNGSTDWTSMGIGGDGFYCLVDVANPAIVFAEYQYCSYGSGPFRSTNGGVSFGTAPSGLDPSERYNWCAPMVMNPKNHLVMLTGGQRVYQSVNNGVAYVAVSPDLSTNPPSTLNYGTISTLDISPADTSTYYAGTDDGQVWRSTNRGVNWTLIKTGLPVRAVTRVAADPLDPNVVYVTLSGFGVDEHIPHVFRSTNRGTSWTAISSNLPDAPVNDLVVDPLNPQTLYIGTDLGVYATRNLGAGWYPFGVGMPIQPVFDLSLHSASRTLIAATHGRSQWKILLWDVPVATEPSPPPTRMALAVPRPNPSRGAVRFSLELPRASALDLSIYDATGRRVRTLCDEPREAGAHQFAWDGDDARGRRVAPGAYFLRASADGAIETRRLIRIE